jgi:hypothetical protein
MSLAELDSRTLFGTDIEYSHYPESPSSGVEAYVIYPPKLTVRVILGELGDIVRMSAFELNIVTEGSNRLEAWARFLDEIKRRFKPDESAWFRFDVGPTRPEEIAKGLDALEDEDWSEPTEDTER